MTHESSNTSCSPRTIVAPSFNQGRFIERTIRSVLWQDHPAIEHVVADGGPKDDTVDILRRYEGKLRWISERDSGHSGAINRGFKMVHGEILAWLSSDDVHLTGAVSINRRIFQWPSGCYDGLW